MDQGVLLKSVQDIAADALPSGNTAKGFVGMFAFARWVRISFDGGAVERSQARTVQGWDPSIVVEFEVSIMGFRVKGRDMEMTLAEYFGVRFHSYSEVAGDAFVCCRFWIEIVDEHSKC